MTSSCATPPVRQTPHTPASASKENYAQLWDDSFYVRLRQRAVHLLRSENPANSAQPEDLVHDAYLRLARSAALQSVTDYEHYLAIATLIMKRSLVDGARAAKALKRFGRLKQTPLTAEIPASDGPPAESVWVRDLLDKCGGRDSRLVRVARMHFVEERQVTEIAVSVGVSERTVKRDLREITKQLRGHFRTCRASRA